MIRAEEDDPGQVRTPFHPGLLPPPLPDRAPGPTSPRPEPQPEPKNPSSPRDLVAA